MTSPEPVRPPVDDELIGQLRTLVRATDATKVPDEQLAGYLGRAKLGVDTRIGRAVLPDEIVVGWYLTVAAEMFDREQAPSSNVPDRFGGDAAVRQQRSTRNPLLVIERDVRNWVPTW